MTDDPISVPTLSCQDETRPQALGGKVAAIADRATRKLAGLTDVRDVKRLVARLDQVKTIVAAVTGNRDNINKIAEPMVEGMVKAGRMLGEMAERGERHSGHGDQRAAAPGVTPLQTIKDLGFTRSRARRWQLAAMLPDEDRLELRRKVLDSDDGLWSLAELLRAAKEYAGKQEQLASVTPSTATIVNERWQDWLSYQSDCDLLLTDPPYSTDILDIESFAAEWLPVALNKVKKTGRAYVCIGAYPKEIAAYLSVPIPIHMVMPQILVWTYRNTLGPSPKFDYKLNWQAILYYRGVDAPSLDCPQMTEQFSVQDINAPDGRQSDRWHAWQKPDELAERFVRHASRPGNLILDPFAGTGTFILAAASLGREAKGCDANSEMVDLAMARGCHVG